MAASKKTRMFLRRVNSTEPPTILDSKEKKKFYAEFWKG